jgi:hypothetical protein
VFGYLLGVDATPAERRADLRALFATYVADAPGPARRKRRRAPHPERKAAPGSRRSGGA